MLHYIQNHLLTGETILCTARKSLILMVRPIAISVALLWAGALVRAKTGSPKILLMSLLVSLALLGIRWIDIRQHELAVTSHRVAGKTGIIRKSVQDCPLDKVDVVKVENGLLGAVFGYGTVVIQTVNGTFRFDHIVRPDQFRNEIMKAI